MPQHHLRILLHPHRIPLHPHRILQRRQADRLLLYLKRQISRHSHQIGSVERRL
jgi:hypothetical protein